MGRHLLGPHVVGQRVVVRHVVRGETGPTGGPALNDVLGVCRSWEPGPEGTVVIDSDRGAVRVALSPTSSRASRCRRGRRCGTATPARDVELHTHALWPDLVAEPLGEWVLRCAPPYGGRLRRRATRRWRWATRGVRSTRRRPRVQASYRELGPAADGAGRSPTVRRSSPACAGLGWHDLGSGVRALPGRGGGQGPPQRRRPGARARRPTPARRRARRRTTTGRDGPWSGPGTVRRPAARRWTATGWCLRLARTSTPRTAGRAGHAGRRRAARLGRLARGADRVAARGDRQPPARAVLRAARASSPTTPTATCVAD